MSTVEQRRLLRMIEDRTQLPVSEWEELPTIFLRLFLLLIDRQFVIVQTLEATNYKLKKLSKQLTELQNRVSEVH